METVKRGSILVHERNRNIHWHVLVASGTTIHLYDPATSTHRSLNGKLLGKYKVWHPPTGERRRGKSQRSSS